MKNINQKYVRLTINSLIIFLVVGGVTFQTFNSLLVTGGVTSFLYYTTQSNLLMALTAGILIYYDLKNKEMPRVLTLWHHISVVAVTLTYLVFALFLGPYIEKGSYFYSVQNLTLHNFAPILAITSYFLTPGQSAKNSRYLAIISPLSYMIVTYILYFSGVSFGKFELPYFFLEFKKYGWLRIDFPNFGVIYWWITIIIVIFLISFALYALKTKALKTHKVAVVSFGVLLCFTLFFVLFNIIIRL